VPEIWEFKEYSNWRGEQSTIAGHKKKYAMNTLIIQKYIEKPLLIHQRKFDIRVWVLVSSTGKWYFFKEGYLRTSATPYKLDSASANNPYMHLTNNAIQKHSKAYSQFEDGNQLSFSQFQAYLSSTSTYARVNFFADILPKMKNIIKQSLLAARKKLNEGGMKLWFELFGYDFMMDEDLGVWLIEVNTNPCLEESSQLLKRYLRRMVEDMVKIEVDAHFPSPKKVRLVKEKMNKTGRNSKKAKKKRRKVTDFKIGQKGNIDDLQYELEESPNKADDKNDEQINKNPWLVVNSDEVWEHKLSNSMFIIPHNCYEDLIELSEHESFCTT
jgi:hypothetical protein